MRASSSSKANGFVEVVVRPEVEPLDAIGHALAGGQDDDAGRVGAARSRSSTAEPSMLGSIRSSTIAS